MSDPTESQESPNLADSSPGSRAVIKSFLSSAPSFMRLRELGLLPGTEVEIIRRAPLGDPIEISVRGSLLSIRTQEAREIAIEPLVAAT
ncbi:MAG: ferrous iron transport protein A [Verrucomicrobiales bacterium]